MWAKRVFLGGQPRPYLKGVGPSAPQYWGFLSIYAYIIGKKLDDIFNPLDCQYTNVTERQTAADSKDRAYA